MLTADNYADLRNFPYAEKNICYCFGQTTALDGGQAMFWYSETSTETDNGTTILRPTIVPATDPGRWKRVPGYFNSLNNLPPSTPPTIATGINRTLNSNFTPNATKMVVVWYSVKCQVTNPLLVGTSTATAFLEISTNGGANWTLAGQVGNESGVGITVTVQLTNGQTGLLSAPVPAGALVRIRTATNGTASVTYISGSGVELTFN